MFLYPDPCPCIRIPVPKPQTLPQILLRGLGTFSRPGKPIPGNFVVRRPSPLISESSPLISYITFMRIWVVLWDSGTPLERSAAKNYANPRYKCAEISDGDPIGDQNHNEGNPQFWSHANPLISLFPHLGAGGHGASCRYPQKML